MNGRTFIQWVRLLCFLATVMGARSTSAASLTWRVMADNYFSIYTGMYDGELLQSHGGDRTGFSPIVENYSWSATDEYIYVVAWSDDRHYQALIFELLADGGLFGTSVDGLWEVSATGSNFNSANGPSVATVTADIKSANAATSLPRKWHAPAVTTYTSSPLLFSNWFSGTGPFTMRPLTAIWHDKGDDSGPGAPFVGHHNHDEYLIFRHPRTGRLPAVTEECLLEYFQFDVRQVRRCAGRPSRPHSLLAPSPTELALAVGMECCG